MKKRIGFALAAILSVAPGSASTAVSPTPGCVATLVLECAFSCVAGAHLLVESAGEPSGGSATCGGATASCGGGGSGSALCASISGPVGSTSLNGRCTVVGYGIVAVCAVGVPF